VLRGGLRLFVGRSTTPGERALVSIAQAFLAATVVIVVSAFGVALLTAAGLRRRVTAIDEALAAVQQGHLSSRAAVRRQKGDEIDGLGDAVNMMLDRVEALIAAQRDVTDNIAHETRTPLMQLDANLIKALEYSSDPLAIDALDAGRVQIRRLLRLYDALLDIASSTGQRGDRSTLSDINLSDIATSLIDLYTASAEDAGLRLEHDIAPDVVFSADAMQMSHLMVNLLDNAFKYGAAGGYIGFRLAPGPVIVVEDRGPGIADGEKAAVFDRYHRTQSEGTRGHGLGLALVKAIAARHGLKVKVEDLEPGAAAPGARFTIWGGMEC